MKNCAKTISCIALDVGMAAVSASSAPIAPLIGHSVLHAANGAGAAITALQVAEAAWVGAAIFSIAPVCCLSTFLHGVLGWDRSSAPSSSRRNWVPGSIALGVGCCAAVSSTGAAILGMDVAHLAASAATGSAIMAGGGVALDCCVKTYKACSENRSEYTSIPSIIAPPARMQPMRYGIN